MLSQEAYKLSTSSNDPSKVFELMKELEHDEDAEAGPSPEDIDLDNLLNAAVRDNGLRWRLDCLNKSLGSLRDGDFGFIFKRPETGGTAFLADNVSYMLDQTDRPIMWVNNEEQNNKVILRIYQAYFGVTLQQLLANTSKYKAAFNDKFKERLLFFGIDQSNRKDIEHLVRQYNPALVVYDQLDKVQGFESDRDDLKLGAIYEWARNLAKVGHAGIGVTQADGTAENTKWLTMQHVANAKTSKQAEADWILGMGKIHAEGAEAIRYLSICKNKLIGDQDSLSHLRHGRFEVLLDQDRMRFKDIVDYG